MLKPASRHAAPLPHLPASFSPYALRLIGLWLQSVWFFMGILLLAYCLFAWSQAAIGQANLQRAFGESLSRKQPPFSELQDPIPQPLPANAVIGRLQIDRLGLSTMILEGTSPATLQNALGHITGTALPGQKGNAGIAGHRDTFFLPLRHVVLGDHVRLTTLRGEFHYRVVHRSVVSPAAVSVLQDRQRESLTLVTCFPFFFAGPAPYRYVIHAERLP